MYVAPRPLKTRVTTESLLRFDLDCIVLYDRPALTRPAHHRRPPPDPMDVRPAQPGPYPEVFEVPTADVEGYASNHLAGALPDDAPRLPKRVN